MNEDQSSYKFDEQGIRHFLVTFYNSFVKAQIKFWIGVVVGMVIALLLV